MKLFDCHNHIQDERLFPILGNVMERAHKAGVVAMGVKGCSEEDWPRVIQLYQAGIRQHKAEQNDGPLGGVDQYFVPNHSVKIYPSFGLHPWFISDRSLDWFQTLEALLINYPEAAVGEIGIDHAIEDRDDADQESVFLKQLEIAQRLNRPVSIHCRQAWGRLIELFDQFGDFPRGMLIHCFGGSAEVATELVKRGAYISFSGSITRPNARKAGAAIRAVPDDRILIETDAPDILPHNCRAEMGKDLSAAGLNEPANVRFVLAKAAELRGVSETELAEITFRNAEHYFQYL